MSCAKNVKSGSGCSGCCAACDKSGREKREPQQVSVLLPAESLSSPVAGSLSGKRYPTCKH
jgi:hypothetical protein